MGLGVGSWSLKSKGGQRESGRCERGKGQGPPLPPFVFPRRHNSFSFRLALGTMGREVSRALQLHVKQIITERM